MSERKAKVKLNHSPSKIIQKKSIANRTFCAQGQYSLLIPSDYWYSYLIQRKYSYFFLKKYSLMIVTLEANTPTALVEKELKSCEKRIEKLRH